MYLLLTIKKIIPYNNFEVSNESSEWMLWCEAVCLSKWKFNKRKKFLNDIQDKHPERNKMLKKYLTYIWENK